MRSPRATKIHCPLVEMNELHEPCGQVDSVRLAINHPIPKYPALRRQGDGIHLWMRALKSRSAICSYPVAMTSTCCRSGMEHPVRLDRLPDGAHYARTSSIRLRAKNSNRDISPGRNEMPPVARRPGPKT
jgi:hypothetical protein